MKGRDRATESGRDGRGTVCIVSPIGAGAVATLARTIRDRGLAATLITGPLGAERAAQLAALVDRMVAIDDPFDPLQVAAAATGLAGDRKPAAVLTWWDGSIVVAAAAAKLLGIDTSPVTGLARARNKHAARRALAAAGLSVPPFALMTDVAEAEVIATTVGLPAIVKPIAGAASVLVRLVRSVAELVRAYEAATTRLPTVLPGIPLESVADPGGQPVDGTRALLVEGMLRGREYSADVIVRDGDVEVGLVLDKFLVTEEFFECGFVWPPLDVCTPEWGQLIADTVTRAIRALGLENTVAHVELIDDEQLGPTIVEVNAGRPGGQIIGLLMRHAVGWDVAAEHLALALGDPPPLREAPLLPPPLATMTVFPERSGRVRSLHGLEELAKHPNVVSVVPHVKPGDLVSAELETYAVNALVSSLGTRRQLLDLYAEMTRIVRIDLEPL